MVFWCMVVRKILYIYKKRKKIFKICDIFIKKKWIMYKVNLLNNYDWLWSFLKEKINELKYFMYEDKFNFYKL